MVFDKNTKKQEYSLIIKVFFITLVVPIIAIAISARINFEFLKGEFNANIFSTVIALICWIIAGWFLVAKTFGKQTFLVLTAFILIRIILNYIHFYYIFSPLAGITSAADLPQANFSGDIGAIYNSAIIFIKKMNSNGLFFAIFGNYYRGINNPGVAIIYGTLFNVFGTYGTVAISWAVIYSAFASIIIGLIGLYQKLPVNLCKATTLLVFFMPGIFIFSPVYRDNFIVYCLSLTAFTAVLLPRGHVVLLSIFLIIESIFLFSLRLVYLILPALFGIISVFVNMRSKKMLTKRGVVFGIILIVGIVIAWEYVVPYLDIFSIKASIAATAERPRASILSPFIAMGPVFFYPAAAIFSIMTPMPWWQDIAPTLLSYQIFCYAQTWYALTILIALFFAIRNKNLPKEGLNCVIFAFILLFLVLGGTTSFSQGYVIVAIPFMIQASIGYLFAHWKKSFFVSSAVIASAHAFLFYF